MAVSLPADVVSMNLAHRHLTQQQLIMAASKLEAYYTEEAKKRQIASGGPHPGKAVVANLPQPVAGKAFGVSGRSVAKWCLRPGWR